MAGLKSLLTRARKAARDHLPAEVTQAARTLRDSVARHAPSPIAEVVNEYVPPQSPVPSPADPRPTPADTIRESDKGAPDAGAPERPVASEASPARASSNEILARVKTKADKGLKPEDSVVVVYSTPEFAEDAAAIVATLAEIETSVREIDLDRERPQVKRQLAELTGAMVPPYVYINGRHWGGRYDIESLAGTGDLRLVVANRLDEISDDARRIGKVRDSFSDEVSVDNILARWRMGHILCADDLDAWFEVDKDGVERFFYQGAPRDVSEMPAAAAEIAAAVRAEQYDATWQLDPTVGLP